MRSNAGTQYSRPSVVSDGIVMERRFAWFLAAWEKGAMYPRKVFDWLIALTVAAGLLATPLAVPAMAAPQSTAAGEMAAMAGDMPCCPDQQDQKAKDCGSCAFALCLLTITLPAPDGVGTLFDRSFSRSAFALPDDLLADGLGEHPLDQPPRTIV